MSVLHVAPARESEMNPPLTPMRGCIGASFAVMIISFHLLKVMMNDKKDEPHPSNSHHAPHAAH